MKLIDYIAIIYKINRSDLKQLSKEYLTDHDIRYFDHVLWQVKSTDFQITETTVAPFIQRTLLSIKRKLIIDLSRLLFEQKNGLLVFEGLYLCGGPNTTANCNKVQLARLYQQLNSFPIGKFRTKQHDDRFYSAAVALWLDTELAVSRVRASIINKHRVFQHLAKGRSKGTRLLPVVCGCNGHFDVEKNRTLVCPCGHIWKEEPPAARIEFHERTRRHLEWAAANM